MWLISAWLLKQILLKSNWRLHGERLSPGGQQFNPGKWAEKSEKKCKQNGISARAKK